MIRLAFVIPTLDQSGAERQLTLLACNLPRDRYVIKVFALNRGGLYADQLRSHGIEVEVLQKRFRFDPLTYIRLRRGLAAFCPDIVQSYLFAANSYVRLPGICPASAKIVVSERCVDSWKSDWQKKLDRWLISRTHAMTANSQSVAEFYHSLGVPRELISVIVNGIPLSPISPNRDAARSRLGLSDSHRVVGFVGRLAVQKRLKDLIWAFQLLRQTIQNARLVIIGDGPERQALDDLAVNLDCRQLIDFAGHREDAYELTAAFDVFCLPSEFEGMSNSLMEAMSLGLPIVASDIAANKELITHEQTGLLYKPGNTSDLTLALKRLFDEPDLKTSVGSAARQLIIDHHSVERLISGHQQLYEQLILK